ncbi:GNAT family N-acetyltransferase [Sporosarcina sp. YIM B06819]|uniref:GNAT family N-acetyltransferase n=1 Tax=Sporosarcina sp. YIM B06819 TaxID=3081769 RepID=UPI00298C4E71|nr:GNAT family N-acetyltransferase [Sporosarcina sp. YIM B06819]
MKLHFYQPEFDKHIEGYILTDEQLQFTGAPKDAIEFSQTEDNHYPILALDHEQLVTFFALHTCEGVQPYSANASAILIRTFSTDFHHQRKGYARQALSLVPEFVTEHFVGINEIVLAVNVRNTSAQALYKTCGFVDNGVRAMGLRGELIVLSYYLQDEFSSVQK